MNVIVAFARPNDIQNFKSILIKGGYDSVHCCQSGVQALSAMEDLGSGVIICGYRLTDMLYSELLENMPSYFKMLMIASSDKAPYDTSNDNLVFLQSPIKKSDLFFTLNTMLEGITYIRKKAKERRKERSEADRKIISQAKEILMARHHMTEPEAHKYLQKCAMDSGNSMLEAAEMVISLSAI